MTQTREEQLRSHAKSQQRYNNKNKGDENYKARRAQTVKKSKQKAKERTFVIPKKAPPADVLGYANKVKESHLAMLTNDQQMASLLLPNASNTNSPMPQYPLEDGKVLEEERGNVDEQLVLQQDEPEEQDDEPTLVEQRTDYGHKPRDNRFIEPRGTHQLYGQRDFEDHQRHDHHHQSRDTRQQYGQGGFEDHQHHDHHHQSRDTRQHNEERGYDNHRHDCRYQPRDRHQRNEERGHDNVTLDDGVDQVHDMGRFISNAEFAYPLVDKALVGAGDTLKVHYVDSRSTIADLRGQLMREREITRQLRQQRDEATALCHQWAQGSYYFEAECQRLRKRDLDDNAHENGENGRPSKKARHS